MKSTTIKKTKTTIARVHEQSAWPKNLNNFISLPFLPDFIDTYYNLTYKTLSMLYWAHYRMSDGRFRPKWIFKCDDDIFLDIFQFESYLHSFDKLKGSHLICSKREEAVPSRIDKNSTWLEFYTLKNEPTPCALMK